MSWPRVYLYCGLFGFALGLLVIGPRLCGPRAIHASFSLTAGDPPPGR